MLSRWRRLGPMIVAGAVLSTAFVVLGPAGPAHACPVNDPYCEGVEVEEPGHPGGGDTGGNSGGNGGGPCIAEGPLGEVEVPCWDPDLGTYVGNNCYRKRDASGPVPDGAETPGAWYITTCTSADGLIGSQLGEWIPDADAPTLTPEQLARRAEASLRLLPADIQIAPDPAGSGLVGLPVWMWTSTDANTATSATWGVLTASDSDVGLTVTIEARAVSIVWSMGDGRTVTCRNPGTPYEARFGNAPSPTCGHVYATPSRGQPGGVYPVTATTTWQISWSGGGESGSYTRLRQSETTVRIGELQVVTQ